MKKKILLFILVIILVYSVGGVIYYFSTKKEDPVIVIDTKDELKQYGYSLKSNSTALYESEYNNLKTILSADDISYEEYAKSLAKIFIIDLYSISSKLNKYDVGGVEFVYPKAVDNFKLNVQDTLYKYVENNTNGNRTQELPTVKSIKVDDVKVDKFKIEDKEYDSYKVILAWDYENDLEYDTQGEVIVIKDNEKCYVVEKN